MRVSVGEMLCFNSMLSDGKVFGVQVDQELAGKETLVLDTIVRLREDGFIDENRKPSKDFYLATTILKRYKTASSYLIFNRMRVALDQDKRYAIVLHPVDDHVHPLEYEFGVFRREMVLVTLLTGSLFLKEKANEVDEEYRNCTFREWIQELEVRPGKDLLYMQKIQKGKLENPHLFYHYEGIGYLFDVGNECLEKCSCRKVRQLLIDLLEIQVEEGKQNE